MIIKSKPLPVYLLKLSAFITGLVLSRRLKKIHIDPALIKPGHSYILMCNHFSFADGFWAFYLAYHTIWKNQPIRQLHIMSVKKQMQKNWWLQYFGSFSVDPGRLSIRETFDYAAEVLEQPGNILLFFPQARLETCHINHIHFEPGIAEIASRIKGNCQLLWSSNIVDFFESTKPSMYFNMLDCGTNHDFDFEKLQAKVNDHHKKSLQRNIRYTFGDNATGI